MDFGSLFGLLQSTTGELIQFANQVLLDTIIFAADSWLANLAHTGVARVAILGLVLVMALRAMRSQMTSQIWHSGLYWGR